MLSIIAKDTHARAKSSHSSLDVEGCGRAELRSDVGRGTTRTVWYSILGFNVPLETV